jgi:CO/xanthine dehydrogenase Mo-binding subunit
MSDSPEFSRRSVLQGCGGLVVGFALTSASETTVAMRVQDDELPGSLEDNPELDSWIILTENETVTVQTGKVELGQGIQTALSQIAADELDVSLDRVDIVTAETDTTPDEGYTAGSWSMEQSGTSITIAAAEARQLLVEAAAEELDADPEALTVEDGTITDGQGNETTYWEVLGTEGFDHEVTGEIETKNPDEKEYVGESVSRVDIPSKVAGGETYVQDIRLPDMLHGRVVRPPGYAAELVSVDDEAVADMPGVVEVVRDGSFLGVVAETEWQAIQAMEALRDAAEWNVEESLPEQENLYEFLREDTVEESVPHEEGNVDEAMAAANRTVEAEYRKPYQMHASIGPSCAVAQMEAVDQKPELTVWTHSQGVYPLREALAEMLELSEDQITCTHVEGSGCYGHNGADDVAGDAALLSQAVDGQPVRVQWMREQEHQWEPYGSAMALEARAGLQDGQVVGWDYDVWSYPYSTRPPGQPLLAARHREEPLEYRENTPIPLPAGGGTRNAVPAYYEFQSERLTHHFLPEPAARVSALRALGGYGNVFARESFVDELADAAGTDPVEFRLNHVEDQRATEVIRTAAEAADWGQRDLDDNRGLGIAFARYKTLAAFCAVVVEATVDPESGQVGVERAFAAVDSGEAVNPDGIRHQISGGIIQSTSWTLLEDVDFDPEGIVDRDWSDYPILAFPEAPDVEVRVVDRPGEPYLGTGEASQGPTAAAIGNAIYDATGARVREIPITPERVQNAME